MEGFPVKERAANFNAEETKRFKHLVEKYKEVLFNKKSDAISTNRKNRTWTLLCAEFNAGGTELRTIKQLKAKFDNIKRTARKDASREKQERNRTGGGPPPAPVDANTEWLRTVMPISIDGYTTAYDDDAIQQEQNEIEIIDMSGNEVNSESILVQDVVPCSEKIPDAANDEVKQPDATKNEIKVTNKDDTFDAEAPAAMLRKPISSQLQRIKKKSSHTTPQELRDKFKILSDTKTHLSERRLTHIEEMKNFEKELFLLKKKHLEAQRAEERERHLQTMRFEEELHLLKKQELELKINMYKNSIN